jgi:hypothetical protein
VIPSGSASIELDTVCWQQFSDCSALSSNDVYPEKDKPSLVKIIDLPGREVAAKPGEILIHIYDDRSAVKKMIWPSP